MKNILIFSSFERFIGNYVMNEFIDKNISFIDFNDYKIDVLDRENKKYFSSILSKYCKINKVISNINNIDEEKYDFFYTFGNFFNFAFNKIKDKEDFNINQLKSRNIKNNFKKYKDMNEFISRNNIKTYQFMSDPLDLVYDNSILLTPDGFNLKFRNRDSYFFPLYQYFHFIKNKNLNRKKDINFIVGSTAYNRDREIDFNKYLLILYEKYYNNDKYKFFISGYENPFYEIDNFVSHNDFFKYISKSKFGLVLNTYSRTIVSSNKLSAFISKSCVPILTKDLDKDSNFLSDEFKDKLTINNSYDLYCFLKNNINKYNEYLEFVNNKFSDYFNKEFYKDKLYLY